QQKPVSSMRESHFSDLRFDNCGSAGVPVVDFNSQGSGDATNEVSISGLEITAPQGSGILIHNNSNLMRNIKFSRLRIIGDESGAVQGDLVQIGDDALTGQVSNIDFDD